MQVFFQPGRKGYDEQDGNDAAATWLKCLPEQFNRAEPGMRNNDSHSAAEHRGSTEFPGCIDPDKDIDAPKSGADAIAGSAIKATFKMPVISPQAIKAGISGKKMLAMRFNRSLNGVAFFLRIFS